MSCELEREISCERQRQKYLLTEVSAKKVKSPLMTFFGGTCFQLSCMSFKLIVISTSFDVMQVDLVNMRPRFETYFRRSLYATCIFRLLSAQVVDSVCNFFECSLFYSISLDRFHYIKFLWK